MVCSTFLINGNYHHLWGTYLVIQTRGIQFCRENRDFAELFWTTFCLDGLKNLMWTMVDDWSFVCRYVCIGTSYQLECDMYCNTSTRRLVTARFIWTVERAIERGQVYHAVIWTRGLDMRESYMHAVTIKMTSLSSNNNNKMTSQYTCLGKNWRPWSKRWMILIYSVFVYIRYTVH